MSRIFPMGSHGLGFRAGFRGAARRGFTLLELLTVVAIIGSLAAIGSPIISSLTQSIRLDESSARMRAGILRMQQIAVDNSTTADRNETLPRIPGAIYAGVGLVVRWNGAAGEYEVFWVNHNQGATDLSATTLASQSKVGYSRVPAYEPFILSNGIRMVGTRRNDAQTGKLGIIPDNFIITMTSNGLSTPTQQTVYVNLQSAPVNDNTFANPQPWRQWNTSGMYDSQAVNSLTTPEGFATSLPMVILYRDDDIPFQGAAPVSGKPWRITNTQGDLVLNPALEANDILQAVKCRVVVFPLQGGAPLDF